MRVIIYHMNYVSGVLCGVWFVDRVAKVARKTVARLLVFNAIRVSIVFIVRCEVYLR